MFTHAENNRMLYFFPDAPDWITINLRYKPIFDLFTGQNSIDVIKAYISRNYKEEENILIPQVLDLINTSKIFIHNETNKMTEKQFTINNVYLTLTDQCNLNCIYCYATERAKVSNASLSEWCLYVNKILEVSKECTFVFTGGEPLLVPYVFELAEYIKQQKQSSILITNGTQITDIQTAQRIAHLFQHVRISLDSIDEQISSYLRGKNTLAKVIQATKLLEEAGADYVVMSTVCKLNESNIDEFSRYFNDKVHFQPFYQMGKGREFTNLYITGKEYFDALSSTSVFKYLQGFHNSIHSYKNNPNKRCAMATEEISISSNGDIYPCHMLHYSDLKLGNLNQDDLVKLYYESDKMNELRRVNVDSISQCSTCTFRNICGGACRARADFALNGIYGHNNFCDFEKEAILKALMYSFG